MQTRALKTLLEISRAGSFATAASDLNMTLSAVSMQMKSLEAELGTALFDRTFRPPQLTSVGRSVCHHALRLMETEAALIDVCRPADRLTGTFRIGFVATASVRLLPGFLTRSHELAPEAEFDIETGLSDALEARILGGQLDAAVVTASHNLNPGLTYQVLQEERLAYAAPVEFSKLTPGELFHQLPFCQFNPQSGIGKLIAAHVRPLNPHTKKDIVLDNVEAIMECVNKGLGFTLLPGPDIERYAGNKAHLIETGKPGISRDLVLATSARGNLTSRANEIRILFA